MAEWFWLILVGFIILAGIQIWLVLNDEVKDEDENIYGDGGYTYIKKDKTDDR